MNRCVCQVTQMLMRLLFEVVWLWNNVNGLVVQHCSRTLTKYYYRCTPTVDRFMQFLFWTFDYSFWLFDYSFSLFDYRLKYSKFLLVEETWFLLLETIVVTPNKLLGITNNQMFTSNIWTFRTNNGSNNQIFISIIHVNCSNRKCKSKSRGLQNSVRIGGSTTTKSDWCLTSRLKTAWEISLKGCFPNEIAYMLSKCRANMNNTIRSSKIFSDKRLLIVTDQKIKNLSRNSKISAW